MAIPEDRLKGLHKGFEDLQEATGQAVAISEKNIGVDHTGRQNRALMVFTKLISHNMSIINLIGTAVSAAPGQSLLDHFSVAALGRASMDAALMTMYLSHLPLTLDEWNLRRHVLYLHDATNRKRFLEAMAKAEGVTDKSHLEGYSEAKTAMQEKIKRFGSQIGLPDDELSELSAGSLVFVRGFRGAIDEAGWNKKAFEAQHSYLSAFVHSHPVSFIRAVDHEVSFSEPSEYQKYLCNYVSGTIASYTKQVNERVESFCANFEADPLGHVE